MERLISLLGLGVFVAIAYALSNNRKAVRWKPVLWGIALQLIFALLILRTPFGLALFKSLGNGITHFLDFSDVGAEFVFGENFRDFFVAFKILPTIIFFSAFISLLYHYGILQRLIRLLAQVMVRFMGTSGSESLSAAANIFVGQTEAPLLIKPYVATTTQSELFAIMTGGFATIAGGVMAAYISFGIPPEHLIAASVMSAPAALAIAKLMHPETEDSPTSGQVTVSIEKTSINAIDAITTGTLDGLKLALNVGAMLLVFLALVAMVNGGLGWVGNLINLPGLSLELLLGYALAPIAWLMGIPSADCITVGALLGKKTILNEFLAYLDLKALMENTAAIAAQASPGINSGDAIVTPGDAIDSLPSISDRAATIATFALCGFSNLGSIGITVGGISAIAPGRQQDLARMGFRAMVAGSLTCFMTAAIAGILL